MDASSSSFPDGIGCNVGSCDEGHDKKCLSGIDQEPNRIQQGFVSENVNTASEDDTMSSETKVPSSLSSNKQSETRLTSPIAFGSEGCGSLTKNMLNASRDDAPAVLFEAEGTPEQEDLSGSISSSESVCVSDSLISATSENKHEQKLDPVLSDKQNSNDNDKAVAYNRIAKPSNRVFGAQTSKYYGLCWNKTRQTWLVRIPFKGERQYVGNYRSEVEGAIAYDKRAIELFGTEAILNFPDFVYPITFVEQQKSTVNKRKRKSSAKPNKENDVEESSEAITLSDGNKNNIDHTNPRTNAGLPMQTTKQELDIEPKAAKKQKKAGAKGTENINQDCSPRDKVTVTSSNLVRDTSMKPELSTLVENSNDNTPKQEKLSYQAIFPDKSNVSPAPDVIAAPAFDMKKDTNLDSRRNMFGYQYTLPEKHQECLDMKSNPRDSINAAQPHRWWLQRNDISSSGLSAINGLGRSPMSLPYPNQFLNGLGNNNNNNINSYNNNNMLLNVTGGSSLRLVAPNQATQPIRFPLSVQGLQDASGSRLYQQQTNFNLFQPNVTTKFQSPLQAGLLLHQQQLLSLQPNIQQLISEAGKDHYMTTNSHLHQQAFRYFDTKKC